MINKVSLTGNIAINENQKELLDVYDSLRQVDNRLTELISSLEEELPLGQEFDLNDPDTYLELFKRSRCAFSSLSYSIGYCKSYLRDKKRKPIVSKLTVDEIFPKESTLTIFKDFLEVTRDVTLTLLAFFIMSFWSVKVLENYHVIDHFCKTFSEKNK